MTTPRPETTKPAAAKKVKRVFLLTVVADRAKKEFSPGLGIGVLTSVEVTFNLPEAQYSAPMFALSLLDQQTKLRDTVISLGAVEVLPALEAKPTAGERVKRIFKLTVVVDRAKEEFSPGMGIGVLASVEATFNLTRGQYASTMFAMSLLDQQQSLRDSVINLGAVEVFPASKATPGTKPATRRTPAVPKNPATPAAE